MQINAFLFASLVVIFICGFALQMATFWALSWIKFDGISGVKADEISCLRFDGILVF
ncbi:MAG: hypothetical protein MR902_07025 [Campylobacter sp.]|nr:hypothetical protein [Campylobacter sp.]